MLWLVLRSGLLRRAAGEDCRGLTVSSDGRRAPKGSAEYQERMAIVIWNDSDTSADSEGSAQGAGGTPSEATGPKRAAQIRHGVRVSRSASAALRASGPSSSPRRFREDELIDKVGGQFRLAALVQGHGENPPWATGASAVGPHR